MKLVFIASLLLINAPLFGMQKTREILDQYPKTSSFIAGALATASVLEAYHLFQWQ